MHPGTQWEVTTSDRKRADVINYQPEYFFSNVNPAANEMELWELKTSAYFPLRAAAEFQALRQANGYLTQFKADSRVDPDDASAGSRWDGLTLGDGSYTDRFVVKVTTCRDNPKATFERHYDYFVSGGGDGVLIADRTIRDYRCNSSRQREQVHFREKPAYGTQFWEIGEGGEQTDDEGDKFLVRLRDVCIAIRCTQLPVPLPVPGRIPIPGRVPVPVISAALLDYEVIGEDAWSLKSEEFCGEAARLELATGGNSTRIADICRGATSFPALVNDPDFLAFLLDLNQLDYSILLALIVLWVHDDVGDNVSSPARVTGDPHLVTLDGLDYDMQSVGEFELLSVSDRDIQIQARFAAAGTQSSVVAVATQWGDTYVELRADGSTLFNGELAVIEPGDWLYPR